jgi:hypothetical protein
MPIRSVLSITTMYLLLIGFLTNSVMQRVVGPVEGSPLWPLLVLVIVLAVTVLQISRIDRYLKSIDQ